MFKRTEVSTALAIAFGGILSVAAASASAQQSLERVEITGSAIKRIAREGALPVTLINRAEIEKSGASSVSELLQKLPSMQGFTTSSESVNGGGGGTTTASIHSLGQQYTLVLLNGRRLAPFGGTRTATVNLESLPLSAIDRVEVLTDGAGALYGSDAIGGVVNFILRRDRSDGSIEISADKSEAGGANSKSISISKGMGAIDTDGFNILFSYSHDQQDELKAVDRSFSRSGIIRGIDGQNLGLRLFSSNTVPGTVLLQQRPARPPVNPEDDDGSRAFYTPHLLTNGSCPALHVVAGATCRFDFASQVQLVPESRRDTILTSGRVKINSEHELFSEVVLSKFSSKPRYAPAAQPGLFLNQALYDKYVTPFLSGLGLTQADIEPLFIGTDSSGQPLPGGGDPLYAPQYNVRVFDAGGRQDKYTYDSRHFVLGSEGVFSDIDYSASLVHSEVRYSDAAIGGYLSKVGFERAIETGTYDPLSGVAGTQVAGLASAVLNEVLDEQKSSLDTLSVRGSREVFEAAGGSAQLALGADLSRQRVVDNPSAISQGRNKLQPDFNDAIIGGGGGALPFDTKRDAVGLFGELNVPVSKGLEASGSLRYDVYSAARNSRNFDSDGNPIGEADQGKRLNAATYKVSAKFQPNDNLLFRGSLGTGFKAPAIADITNPVQSGGVTSGSYDCPFKGTGDPLAASCRPDDSQYNILSGGQPATGDGALKPERSRQWTLGFRVEPTQTFSIGADIWNVSLKDKILVVPETAAFADPVAFHNMFTVAPDPVTGAPQLTLVQQPINLTSARYRGIDLDVIGRLGSDVGRITTALRATYMLKADYEVPGLPGFQTSLGKFGVDQDVVFRWVAKLTASLEAAGGWTHTIAANYKSGYQDHQAVCVAGVCSGPEIRVVDPTTGAFGARVSYTRRVAEYLTFDWQTKFDVSKALSLTFGVRNLTDQDPPFSMQDGGGGNMRGYDGRYADPVGRAYYVKAGYKF